MMSLPYDLRRSMGLAACCLAALTMAACATGDSSLTGTGGSDGSGGSQSSGGSTGTGGASHTGGSIGSGGVTGSGGSPATGGTIGTGGARGGSTGTGGVVATGGTTATGGARGGTTGTGGAAGSRGGTTGTGGARGGSTGTGGGAAGAPGSGGSTGGGGAVMVDCSATLPSGGTMHTGSSQGTAGSLSWSLWQNGSGGSITTFSTPAFSSSWGPSSGDFLARIGLQWGNSGKAYTSLGTVAADYTETKSGSGGGYSYIGIYGWSVNPCVEWYIVDDSYNKMPVNPGSTTNKGTVTIDGGSYILYTRNTSGTGGSRCGSTSNWLQFYSIRQTARTCGRITISDHFDAWNKAGMMLGNVLEASILVEVGGGTGSIQFPVANVTAQ